jgi:hypothetical protein
VSLQQSCLANAYVLPTEIGRHYLPRAFEGARDPILRHSLVPGLRGGNGTAWAAVPAANIGWIDSRQGLERVRTTCSIRAGRLRAARNFIDRRGPMDNNDELAMMLIVRGVGMLACAGKHLD